MSTFELTLPRAETATLSAWGSAKFSDQCSCLRLYRTNSFKPIPRWRHVTPSPRIAIACLLKGFFAHIAKLFHSCSRATTDSDPERQITFRHQNSRRGNGSLQTHPPSSCPSSTFTTDQNH